MKTKIIPFDAKMAKDIQDGKIEGRIRSKEGGFTARIICFDKIKLINRDGTIEKQIVSLIYNENACEDFIHVHNQKGEVQASFGLDHGYDLVLEVPDEPQFKPFDKVLVRDCEREHPWWTPAIFQETDDSSAPYMASGLWWKECIPYEGNEHLVGTTDNPE